MPARAGVDLAKQLLALISEDAPHEYARCASFVELTLDEDECFSSSHDVVCLRLVGGKLTLDK
jgi:hypothetical protein